MSYKTKEDLLLAYSKKWDVEPVGDDACFIQGRAFLIVGDDEKGYDVEALE